MSLARRYVPLSPNEEAQRISKENEERRLKRLQQVREQERGYSAQLREKYKQRKAERESTLERSLRNKWEEDKARVEHDLFQKYDEIVGNIGSAHHGASAAKKELVHNAQMEYNNWIKSRLAQDQRFKSAITTKHTEEMERNSAKIAREEAQERMRASEMKRTVRVVAQYQLKVASQSGSEERKPLQPPMLKFGRRTVGPAVDYAKTYFHQGSVLRSSREGPSAIEEALKERQRAEEAARERREKSIERNRVRRERGASAKKVLDSEKLKAETMRALETLKKCKMELQKEKVRSAAEDRDTAHTVLVEEKTLEARKQRGLKQHFEDLFVGTEDVEGGDEEHVADDDDLGGTSWRDGEMDNGYDNVRTGHDENDEWSEKEPRHISSDKDMLNNAATTNAKQFAGGSNDMRGDMGIYNAVDQRYGEKLADEHATAMFPDLMNLAIANPKESSLIHSATSGDNNGPIDVLDRLWKEADRVQLASKRLWEGTEQKQHSAINDTMRESIDDYLKSHKGTPARAQDSESRKDTSINMDDKFDVHRSHDSLELLERESERLREVQEAKVPSGDQDGGRERLDSGSAAAWMESAEDLMAHKPSTEVTPQDTGGVANDEDAIISEALPMSPKPSVLSPKLDHRGLQYQPLDSDETGNHTVSTGAEISLQPAISDAQDLTAGTDSPRLSLTQEPGNAAPNLTSLSSDRILQDFKAFQAELAQGLSQLMNEEPGASVSNPVGPSSKQAEQDSQPESSDSEAGSLKNTGNMYSLAEARALAANHRGNYEMEQPRAVAEPANENKDDADNVRASIDSIDRLERMLTASKLALTGSYEEFEKILASANSPARPR